MAALTFKKATRTQAKARVALIGPSGSGKTYTGLLIAHALGKRVAVIDTEHGSASKYVGEQPQHSDLRFDFDVLELDTFSPDTYVDAIEAAAKAGYEVLLIDSLSHAWMGKDGALEQVDKGAKKSQSGNSFTAWRDVTPKHNRLVETMAACGMHLIVTMRSKMEYVLEQVEVQRNGRSVTITQPRKVGLAPIQREGLEYEFDVVGDIDLEHNWVISKTRCSTFDGAVIDRPGEKFAAQYLAWLQTGEAAPPKPAPAANVRQLSPAQRPAAFLKNAKWDGAEQWNGKPLADAPLDTLLEYETVIEERIGLETDEKISKLLIAHEGAVRAAIAAKEPQLEREQTQDDVDPDPFNGADTCAMAPPGSGDEA